MSGSKSTNISHDAPLSKQQSSLRMQILVSTYFAYTGFYLCRKVFSICKNPLAREFHVDVSVIAHIWTAFLVSYMVGQMLTSFIGRKWGPRVLLLGGLGITMVINLVFGFADSYATFMGFMIFNGLVQAAGWPGCVGGVAHWLRRKERGTVMGIWSTNYLVGNIIVKSLGGFLLGSLGWRFAFFGCVLVASVIWWLVYFWQYDKPEDAGIERIVETGVDESRSVNASNEERISFTQFLKILLNPIVLMMGMSYFCLKFLRYALDSWTPTFLNLLGLSAENSAYYSMIFDFVGLPGVILTGILLDRVFRGQWAPLCLTMGFGMVAGSIAILLFGSHPIAFALCCGIIGFALYGPDTLLGGAAAVQVAGEMNAVAVAGIVNGLGSIGPIIQEEVIGQLFKGQSAQTGIYYTSIIALCMSIVFVLVMVMASIQVKKAQQIRSA